MKNNMHDVKKFETYTRILAEINKLSDKIRENAENALYENYEDKFIKHKNEMYKNAVELARKADFLRDILMFERVK